MNCQFRIEHIIYISHPIFAKKQVTYCTNYNLVCVTMLTPHFKPIAKSAQKVRISAKMMLTSIFFEIFLQIYIFVIIIFAMPLWQKNERFFNNL